MPLRAALAVCKIVLEFDFPSCCRRWEICCHHVTVTLILFEVGALNFIVGHNRDRDSYQVPAALAEVSALETFVTDYYEGRGFSVPTLSHRRTPLIDASRVRQSWGAFAAQLPYEVKRRIKRSVDFPTVAVESRLGATIARVAAQKPEADLLLYSGSALQAFQGPSTGRRILFQYQVSPQFIVDTLSTVDDLQGVRPWLREAEELDPGMQEQHVAEVNLADSAVCASSFTKRGLIAQGMDPENITVAPYGGPRPERIPEDAAAGPTCSMLFVGQGIARKGLHILVEAWRRAALKNATLTLVTSRHDPEIEDFARGVPNINFVGRHSKQEVLARMRTADTLLLPSIAEGFGLVLSEALSQGCRLLASFNTGLVDMELPENLGVVVEPGSVDSLVEGLQRIADTYEPRRSYRDLVFDHSERLSWAGFRRKVRQGAGLPTEIGETARLEEGE